MTKLYFITFGNEKYYNSLQRIKKEVENFNIFDEIIIKNDKDLKDDIEFWNKHSDFIKKYNRGYGYWIWKPYINLKLMEKIIFYIEQNLKFLMMIILVLDVQFFYIY